MTRRRQRLGEVYEALNRCRSHTREALDVLHPLTSPGAPERREKPEKQKADK